MAGEMSQESLEPGGEFYDSRLKLEEFIKSVGGYTCVVKPFDAYQGPYAQIFKGSIELGSLWLGEVEDSYLFEFDSRMERVEINSADDLFYLLISIYETYHSDIKVLKVKSLKNTLKIDLLFDGEKFTNVGLGRLPNRNDAFLKTISNEDGNKYIEISSSFFKSKPRIVNF